MNKTDRLEIKFVSKPGVKIPEYRTSGSAGCDVCAFLEEEIVLKAGKRAAIPTGLFVSIPEGYEIQVRPRSGLSLKNGITVLNSPGTIDSDYRGEICVILINLGDEDFVIRNGDRIAQLVISSVTQGVFVRTESLDSTERGSGGFGSTGVST